MRDYLHLLELVLADGDDRSDRTGTGTRSVFGVSFRHSLSEGFPMLTTKRVFWKGVVAELLWFLAGDTNAKTLQDQGVGIWDEWAGEDGELGPVYGKQWRRWTGHKQHGMGTTRHDIDQLGDVLKELVANPGSRRLVVSAWNVADLPEMALAPCHCLFQLYTRKMSLGQRFGVLRERFGDDSLAVQSWMGLEEEGRINVLDANGIPSRFLDLQLYQRSADVFLGVPFNIASYALLTHLIARHAGMVPGDFVHTFGDLHLYANHFEQAKTQLGRTPGALPRLVIAKDAPTNIFEIRAEHLALEGYEPQAAIKAPVAV